MPPTQTNGSSIWFMVEPTIFLGAGGMIRRGVKTMVKQCLGVSVLLAPQLGPLMSQFYLPIQYITRNNQDYTEDAQSNNMAICWRL